MTQRFTADPRAARTERLTAAAGVAVAVPVLLWLTGAARHPAILVAAAAAAAILVLALVSWRAAREGLLWIEVGDEGIEIARRDGRHTVRWSEIARASRASYGGAWVLTTTTATGRPRHLVVRLDALAPADAARLSALIRARVR